MTEKKFRFLEQLEDDLRDAAARERVAVEGGRSRRTASLSSRGGEHRWTRWIAAAVVVLVVAGGIGAFAQYRDSVQNRAGVAGTAYSLAGHGASAGSSSAPQKAANRGVAGAVNGPVFADQSGNLAQSLDGPAAVPAPTHPFVPVNDSVGTPNIAAASPPVQQDLSKIVRNGVITVELPDGKFPSTQTLVTRYADAAGGYVLSSTARGSGSGTFVLRIPAKRFDSVMTQLDGLPGGHVLWQNSSSQDVTAEFVDSGAELQILKAEKAATLRYLKNAGSLSQAIQFRNQAFQIQGEIDKLQGRLNYLSDQVSLATITVNLRETGAPSTHKPTPVSKPSLVRAWDRAVSGFLGVVSAVIVGLGFLIPLGILALLIGLPIMVLTRKRRAASSTS